MDGLIYLIPVALFLGLVGLAGFLWSLRSGQYDDLEGASYRALFEEDDIEEEQKNAISQKNADKNKPQNKS
jgi:cbb3-type cytochrome oxidase maturation protein